MRKRWIQRGIAWILLAVLLLTGRPVYAAEYPLGIREGESCGSVYGERYIGSDGKAYYAEDAEKYLLYNKDGSVSRHTAEAGYARQWFYMINSKGEMQKVFCIEAGVDFEESGNGYTLTSGLDRGYGSRLPASAQKGIALTLLYGWQPGCKLPVSGINEDDYAVATQILLWEYQQQLRLDAGNRRSNGWAQADQFYSNIQGRPAEKAYNWILTKIGQHMVNPSFTASSAAEAELYTMKYDAEQKIYSVTLEDRNKTLADLKWETPGSIQVRRSGNMYTFMSKQPLTSSVTLKLQKKTDYSSEGIFIWGMPGYQTMVSGASDVQYFYLRLETEKDGSIALVKTSQDGRVSDVRFLIEGCGQQLTVTTSEEGKAQIENLKPGTYTITELDTGDYIPQKVQTVIVRSGETAKVRFENQLKKGSLKVLKTAEDGLRENVKFRLHGISLYGTKVDVTAKTDAEGIAYFSNIPISGTTPYTVEEVDTGVQYVVPDAQQAVITWKKEAEVTISNELKKFQLTVHKQDQQLQGVQGDGSLSGAQYGLYRNGELVDIYTTDAEGCFTTSVYACGEGWTLQEMQPSEGYLLDPTVYTVGAEPENYELAVNEIYMEVMEEVLKGQIQIIKHIENDEESSGGVIEQPEEGAVFEVYLKEAGLYDNAAETERALLITDANGYARTQELPYGQYVVHQVSGMEGKALVPDYTVNIAEDGKVYSYILNNRTIRSGIRIEKRDAETGNPIAVSGIGFQVLDAEGNAIIQEIQYPTPMQIDTFYTNEEGWLMLPEALPYGQYQLIEVQAPSGYVKDSEPVTFTVDGSQEEMVIVKTNMAQKGKIRIEKLGEVFATVEENEEICQPVFEVQKLEGVEFTVTAAEDIYTLDGTLRVAKDAVAAIITTDASGIAETGALYMGKYKVTETQTPEGYTAEEPVEVEVTASGADEAVTIHHVKIWNYLQKARIRLHKEMEVSEEYGRGTMGEILSVRFGLYADEDIIAEDGTVIPKGKLIEIASANEEGVVAFETPLPYGKYVMKERSTHEAYKLDTMPRPFEFSYRTDWPIEVEWAYNPEHPVYNEYYKGQIAGRKVDDTGHCIEGAVIGVFSMDETDFCRETALAVATTAANGGFVFHDVPFGSYLVKEIEAPEGYELSDQKYPVDVHDENEFEEVLIVNKYITGKLILNKTDVSTGEPIPGCGIEIQDAEGKILLQDVTDEQGNVEFTLGYGHYYYREYDAPEGYLIDETEYPFSIQEDGQIIKAEMTNQMIEGLLVIEKLDGETGRPLEQCGIEILDENGTILQRQYTDARGLAMFSLLYGSYYYREFDAPEGYELDETARAFNILEDECVLTREMENFKEKEIPKTGDALQPLLPWLTGSAASAVLLLVLWKWRRRRR